MTEAEWLACEEPQAMLLFLASNGSGRKFRLFACACVRRIWALLHDARSRSAVEAAERFAEGLISRADVQRACAKALNVLMFQGMAANGDLHAPRAAYCAASREYVRDTSVEVASALSLWGGDRVKVAELRAHCALLRDIFGSPFGPTPRIEPAWLADNDKAATHLAHGIYEELAFERMPILADALEDAGCAAADLLTHLRSPGPHVRGCWALDLILARS